MKSLVREIFISMMSLDSYEPTNEVEIQESIGDLILKSVREDSDISHAAILNAFCIPVAIA
jgi:hypothetical protein